MLCNKDKKNAPTPYHNRNFSGVWCGADAGVIVGDVESQGDWNYCTELADLLNEEGININSARSYSRGGDDGWDWIIIQVCYNSDSVPEYIPDLKIRMAVLIKHQIQI